LLKTAIRDDNPVIFLEDKMMYKQKGAVPTEEYTIPFGVADVKPRARTLRWWREQHGGSGTGAAKLLEGVGVQRGVIDPRRCGRWMRRRW